MPKAEPALQSAAAAADDSAGSPFDDGVLDAAEKKKIRDLLAPAVSFLTSARLLPAALLRVGPLKVLLPIVWGVGFLRSRRWVAGSTFLGIGLVSLVMTLRPEIQFETVDAEVADDTDNTQNVKTSGESKSQTGSRVSSFMRPKKLAPPTATSMNRTPSGSSFREPIFPRAASDGDASRRVYPAGAVGEGRESPGGVWLLGTIEAVDEGNGVGRTAAAGRPSSPRR